MKSYKICIVSPSLSNGGIERALTNLSDSFVKEGHSVIFIACRRGQHFYSLNENVVFCEPPFTHNNSGIHKITTYFKIVRFLEKKYKEFKPDVILSFGDTINPLAILGNSSTNIPIYISDRISPKQKLSASVDFLKRISYKKATGIIAQTTQAADYKRLVFGDGLNIRIIPNSLRAIKEQHVEKENWIIAVGRLSFEKGVDRLIDAFSKIEEKGNWKLVLVGDGPSRTELESKVDSYGLKECVHFLGARKDVDFLLAKSRIYVIPSRCEGFPNALCEAMASPLPCIAFDSVPTENLIDDNKSGIVVPDGDIEKLALSIETLMHNESLRKLYAKNAYVIRERLNPKKISKKFLDFILEKL